VTHVDDALLADVVARFGPPAEWDGSRELTDADARVIGPSLARGRAHDVTFAILEPGDRVVLVRKPTFPPGAWRIPSGGVHRGEAFEAGAIREAHEETGLEIELTGYPLVARSTFRHRGRPLRWTTHVVTARATGGRLAPLDTQEIEAARFGTLAELTGPIATTLRATGRGLFAYRADLHDRLRELL
jgi:8-oxo-dGTP diphosphatase